MHQGGEIFVPKIPSYKILELANQSYMWRQNNQNTVNIDKDIDQKKIEFDNLNSNFTEKELDIDNFVLHGRYSMPRNFKENCENKMIKNGVLFS